MTPDAGGEPVRVLVADDSFLIREALTHLLALSDAVVVVAVAEDEPAALAAVETETPDVVLTDIRMPPTNTDEGVRIARRLAETHPSVGVVLLSQETNADLAAELVRDGAERRGYLLKDRVHDVDHLVATVLAVAGGECRIDPVLVAGLVAAPGRQSSVLDSLTPRQRELLADVAEGRSNQAIARDRFLSLRAVEKHVSEIFSRLGIVGDADVSRRVRATLMYLEALG